MNTDRRYLQRSANVACVLLAVWATVPACGASPLVESSDPARWSTSAAALAGLDAAACAASACPDSVGPACWSARTIRTGSGLTLHVASLDGLPRPDRAATLSVSLDPSGGMTFIDGRSASGRYFNPFPSAASPIPPPPLARPEGLPSSLTATVWAQQEARPIAGWEVIPWRLRATGHREIALAFRAEPVSLADHRTGDVVELTVHSGDEERLTLRLERAVDAERCLVASSIVDADSQHVVSASFECDGGVLKRWEGLYGSVERLADGHVMNDSYSQGPLSCSLSRSPDRLAVPDCGDGWVASVGRRRVTLEQPETKSAFVFRRRGGLVTSMRVVSGGEPVTLWRYAYR